jgi:hypothetical protein
VVKNNREVPSNLKKQTQEIKALFAALAMHKRMANDSQTKLFSATYLWVQSWMTENNTTKIGLGHTTLAALLETGTSNVQAWYYAGDFMVEKKLPSTANSAAVRMLTGVRRSLEPDRMKEAISLIKKGATARAIRDIIETSTGFQEASGRRELAAAKRNTRLCGEYVLALMQKVHIAATALWGPKLAVVVRDPAGRSLATVK